jgi:signal transduction histidine kinase
MEKSLPGQQNYFEAFIKAAQYLAGLTAQQDIWSETGKVLVNFFGAEVGAVEERRANGETAGHRWVFSERCSSRRDLEAETREAIAEVLECGFLSARIIFTPDPLSIACFPITRENQVVAVMVVGHGMPESLSRERLNVYLAVAGLVGTTVERLASERELWRHRRQLQEEIAERKQAEEALKRIEWMLTCHPGEGRALLQGVQPYGDLTALNTSRVILDTVGQNLLTDIVRDYLDLLGTSSAVYEKNGDYAFGIFSSGWCQFLDLASRNLCGIADNREALSSGKWLCHESCWTEASRVAVQTGEPADIECAGGIRLYAVPIRAGMEIVGSINFGYGDPPRNTEKLREVAASFSVSEEELRQHSEAYESRPPFIIDLAKNRLVATARFIGEIVVRKRTEEELARYRGHLEELVRERTAELEAANKELDAFAYSVSHDLRAPLRHIDGFMGLLQKKAGTALDEQRLHYMDAISESAKKMGRLIDDLLSFSRMGRQAMSFQPVELGTLVREVIRELEPDTAGRDIEWRIADLPSVGGDASLLRIVLGNLISNALKFTRPRQQAQIDIGSTPNQGSEAVIFVRDNGVGFDMSYVDKLFGVFQRLHRADEFEGTGIGLANVRRIIARHGGRTWAEGQVDQGAAFFFSLPQLTPGG